MVSEPVASEGGWNVSWDLTWIARARKDGALEEATGASTVRVEDPSDLQGLELEPDPQAATITPQQIVTRQVWTNPLHWPSPAPADKRGDMTLNSKSEAVIPQWIRDSLITGE